MTIFLHVHSPSVLFVYLSLGSRHSTYARIIQDTLQLLPIFSNLKFIYLDSCAFAHRESVRGLNQSQIVCRSVACPNDHVAAVGKKLCNRDTHCNKILITWLASPDVNESAPDIKKQKRNK